MKVLTAFPGRMTPATDRESAAAAPCLSRRLSIQAVQAEAGQ